MSAICAPRRGAAGICSKRAGAGQSIRDRGARQSRGSCHPAMTIPKTPYCDEGHSNFLGPWLPLSPRSENFGAILAKLDRGFPCFIGSPVPSSVSRLGFRCSPNTRCSFGRRGNARAATECGRGRFARSARRISFYFREAAITGALRPPRTVRLVQENFSGLSFQIPAEPAAKRLAHDELFVAR